MTAPDQFEDALLKQLREVVSARPDPTPPTSLRGRHPRLLIAGTAGLTALAVAALVAGTGDVTTNAYAVESNEDGTVTVSIDRPSDGGALERTLATVGVPAVVEYVPGEEVEGCDAAHLEEAVPTEDASPPDGSTAAAPAGGESEPGVATVPTVPAEGSGESSAGETEALDDVSVEGGEATFTVDPHEIKSGDVVYIATQPAADDESGLVVSTIPAQVACSVEGAE